MELLKKTMRQFKKEFGNNEIKTIEFDGRYWIQKKLLNKKGKNGSTKKISYQSFISK